MNKMKKVIERQLGESMESFLQRKFDALSQAGKVKVGSEVKAAMARKGPVADPTLSAGEILNIINSAEKLN